MKVSICLLIKDENEYLEEWLCHHRKIGINQFYIYDNHSKIPVIETLKSETDCQVKLWEDQGTRTQIAAYNDCCQSNRNDNFILFIDTDEFLMLNRNFISIQNAINFIQIVRGKFSALGLYWRIYGKPYPYFEVRQPVTHYTQYLQYSHIKTIAKPNHVSHFVNPHFASVNGQYISESGRGITGPFSDFHQSDLIWIKHTFTRSIREFQKKIQRGSGDKVNIKWTIEDFKRFNDNCLLLD